MKTLFSLAPLEMYVMLGEGKDREGEGEGEGRETNLGTEKLRS